MMGKFHCRNVMSDMFLKMEWEFLSLGLARSPTTPFGLTPHLHIPTFGSPAWPCSHLSLWWVLRHLISIYPYVIEFQWCFTSLPLLLTLLFPCVSPCYVSTVSLRPRSKLTLVFKTPFLMWFLSVFVVLSLLWHPSSIAVIPSLGLCVYCTPLPRSGPELYAATCLLLPWTTCWLMAFPCTQLLCCSYLRGCFSFSTSSSFLWHLIQSSEMTQAKSPKSPTKYLSLFKFLNKLCAQSLLPSINWIPVISRVLFWVLQHKNHYFLSQSVYCIYGEAGQMFHAWAFGWALACATYTREAVSLAPDSHPKISWGIYVNSRKKLILCTNAIILTINPDKE